MRVIGVDPGTQKTGIGIVERQGNKLIPVFFETISIRRELTRYEKILFIHKNILKVISEFEPSCMSLEDVFFSRNFKAAIRIGEARSAAMLAAALSGLEIFEYLPTKVKGSICGNGRAAKQQVQFMVRSLLRLVETPEEDAADALALALCHFHSEKKLGV